MQCFLARQKNNSKHWQIIMLLLLLGSNSSCLWAVDQSTMAQVQELQQMTAQSAAATNPQISPSVNPNIGPMNVIAPSTPMQPQNGGVISGRPAPMMTTATQPQLPANNTMAPPVIGPNGEPLLPTQLSNQEMVARTTAAQMPAPAYPKVVPIEPTPAFQTPFPTQHMVEGTPQAGLVSQAAYAGLVDNALPLTPAQIHRLKQLFHNSQYAAAAPAGVPPQPMATSMLVNLAPGATPPVVRLAQGFVSSLVFLDSTGAPWPIASYDIGNPSAFNIQWNKKDNTLLVQATSPYTYGNLAVRLRDLNTPVMITLIPGQQVVDYRADLRIQGLGPDANPTPNSSNLPSPVSQILLSVLDGVPPDGSKSLIIPGGAGEAWTKNDKIYLRTRYTVLSPAWLATMSSPDGMKAYELQTTPMILVSEDGQAVQLRIEGL